MNVERLMRDLTIDQLQTIQQSLSQQTDEKREELRKMVGRRYRDVLDASITVRRLTEIAANLSVKLVETRRITRAPSASFPDVSLSGPQPFVKHETILRYALLAKLMPLLDESGADALSSAFALLLAENLHRAVSIACDDFTRVGVDLSTSLKTINVLLIQHRLRLLDSWRLRLCDDTEWHSVTGLLIAMALLQQYNIADLQHEYLQARRRHILDAPHTCATLLHVIEAMKTTVECVDNVFGHGAAIVSGLRLITSAGWCPEAVLHIVQFDMSTFERLLRSEVLRINAAYSHDRTRLKFEAVEGAAMHWIGEVCMALEARLDSMATLFASTTDIIAFLIAIDDLFAMPWPCITSNITIYNQLFRTSLLLRFRTLITSEVDTCRELLLTTVIKNTDIATQPVSLFQRHATRYDALIASGVSKDLHDAIEAVFVRLADLLVATNRYVAIGRETERMTELPSALCQAALNLTSCLVAEADHEDVDVADAKTFWLTRFRLFLALVQHEPAVLSQCMGHNTEAIIQCNKLLHAAAEKSLCKFMDAFIMDAVAEAQLQDRVSELVATPLKFLDLALETEKHRLTETDATTIDIPTQLSGVYFALLNGICARTNAAAVGHLFTRNVTTHVAKMLGRMLAASVVAAAHAAADGVIVILTQILFDAKVLFFMFLDPGFLEAVRIIEEDKLDAITRAVLIDPLTKNAKLFVQRTTLLFGQLQVEPMTLHDGGGIDQRHQAVAAESYANLIDVTPFIADVPRLPLIPGMSILKQQQQPVSDAVRRKKQPMTGGGGGGVLSDITKSSSDAVLGSLMGGAKQNISSLYDKFSTNWFKN